MSACEMRPVTTSSKTETWQNSLVGRCGVGRGFCLSSGEGACRSGAEASLTGKGLPASAGRGVGPGISRLGSQCGRRAVYCRGFCVYPVGRGGIWGQRAPLFPERCLCNATSQGCTPRRANNLPASAPGISQMAVSTLAASGLFACLLSSGR